MFWTPRPIRGALQESSRRGPAGACAPRRRVARLASPAALRATDTAPLIISLVFIPFSSKRHARGAGSCISCTKGFCIVTRTALVAYIALQKAIISKKSIPILRYWCRCSYRCGALQLAALRLKPMLFVSPGLSLVCCVLGISTGWRYLSTVSVQLAEHLSLALYDEAGNDNNRYQVHYNTTSANSVQVA